MADKNVQLTQRDHHGLDRKFPVCFLATDFDVPMNVGSLFRIADALGVEKIYLTGRSIVPPNSKISRTARYAERYVAHAYRESALMVVAELKQAGYTIISLEITTASIDIRTLTLAADAKVCLILGSDETGVAQELLDVSDYTVHSPMIGHNSSMNVATACAIATFEIVRKYLT